MAESRGGYVVDVIAGYTGDLMMLEKCKKESKFRTIIGTIKSATVNSKPNGNYAEK